MKVAVLMSVYNGSRYLREQIESILGQENVEVSLWIWNDGSTDDTETILREYGNALTYWTGKNQGAAQGFMQAIQLCDTQADYYALSDADDVWLPTKLIDGIRELRQKVGSGPALIATRMTLTDAELNPIGMTPMPVRPLSFENALVQGGIGGASCIMNEPLWRMLKGKRPEALVMHDGWLYLLASAFGTIIYSDQSRIFYRQHGNNVMGAAHSTPAKWKRRWRWLLSKGDKQKDQAKEFLRLFGDQLSPEQRKKAEHFAYHDHSAFSRLRQAIAPKVQFNSAKSRALYSLRTLLGRT